MRRALRLAISPQIENTKALGIVFLPGAMTGLILAGVDPLDAVLVQLALMWIILGAVVVTTATTALAGTRRLFTRRPAPAAAHAGEHVSGASARDRVISRSLSDLQMPRCACGGSGREVP